MTVRAMVHSKKTVEDIDLIEKCGDNDYIVKIKDGTVCHAIYNCFTGLYYADDLYAVVEDYKPHIAYDHF